MVKIRRKDKYSVREKYRTSPIRRLLEKEKEKMTHKKLPEEYTKKELPKTFKEARLFFDEYMSRPRPFVTDFPELYGVCLEEIITMHNTKIFNTFLVDVVLGELEENYIKRERG